MGARFGVSSMRTDPISEPLVRALAASGNQTLTIAPEAGSERLRRVINKSQCEDDLLHAVELAQAHGFPQLKMYFMVGHPTETDDDVAAIADLTLKARGIFRRNIAINATPFTPEGAHAFSMDRDDLREGALRSPTRSEADAGETQSNSRRRLTRMGRGARVCYRAATGALHPSFGKPRS